MKKILIPATGLMLVFVAFLIMRSGTSDPAVRSIQDYDKTLHVTARDWAQFMRNPDRTGWVLLPTPHEGPEFTSDINPHAAGFIRPEVCGECHQDIYESFLQTAHFRTASWPDAQNILGSFAAGKNRVNTRVPGFYFEMNVRDDGFYHDLHVDTGEVEYRLSEKIGLVVGSGNHGQSYLYWSGDQLLQMHVSYFTEMDGWVNSPGFYVDGTADMARPVTGRCVECHNTWFAQAPDSANRFDKATAIPGVTCVRCHGPGREHVEHHQQNPDSTAGQHIVNPGNLRRERMNEVCAQCHSGGEQLRESFTYVPGEPLEDYLAIDLSGENASNEDPHSANQLARLIKSRCFQKSDSMTCATCHNPHQQERGNQALFSDRCRECHQTQDCIEFPDLGVAIQNRCIECHMPARRDDVVSVHTSDGKTVTPLLRDHYIRGWPDAAARVRQSILRTIRSGSSSVQSSLQER